MTFCQIFEVASRVRQKVVDHRSLTIEKCSVQEKKVVGDKRSLMAGSLMTGCTYFHHKTLLNALLKDLKNHNKVKITGFQRLSMARANAIFDVTH